MQKQQSSKYYANSAYYDNLTYSKSSYKNIDSYQNPNKNSICKYSIIVLIILIGLITYHFINSNEDLPDEEQIKQQPIQYKFEQCHQYLTKHYNSSSFYHQQQINNWLDQFRTMKRSINQKQLIVEIQIIQRCMKQFQQLSLNDGSSTKLIKRIYNIIKWADIQPIISNNNESIDKIQNIAIMLGQSRAGKGTLINYLLGIQLKGKQDRNDPGQWTIQIKKKNQKSAQIDNGHQSATLIPKLYGSKQNIYYMDCPGLKDTRGWFYQLINAIFIRKAILNKNISFIFIVPEDKLKQGSSRQGILNSFTALSGFVGNNFETIKKNTILVISKSKPSNQRSYQLWQKFIVSKLKAISQMKALSPFQKQATLFFKQNPNKTGQFKKPYSSKIQLESKNYLIKLIQQNFPIKIQEVELYIKSQAFVNIQILNPHFEQNIKDIIERFQKMIMNQFYSYIASNLKNKNALQSLKQKLQQLILNINKDIQQSVQQKEIKNILTKISNYRNIKQIKSIRKNLISLINDIQYNVEYLQTFSQFKSQYHNNKKKKTLNYSITIKNDLKSMIAFLNPFIVSDSQATVEDFQVLVNYWAQKTNLTYNGGGIQILDIQAKSDWMRRIKNNSQECKTRINGESPFGNRKCSDFKTTTIVQNVKFKSFFEDTKKISKTLWSQVFTNQLNTQQTTQVTKQIQVKQILSINTIKGLKRSGSKKISVQSKSSTNLKSDFNLNIFKILNIAAQKNSQNSNIDQRQKGFQINFQDNNTTQIENTQKWTISQTIVTPPLTQSYVQFKLGSCIFDIQFKSKISIVGWVAVCFKNNVKLRDDKDWNGKCWFASVCQIVNEVMQYGGYSKINNFKMDRSNQNDGTIEGGCKIVYEATGHIKGQKGFQSNIQVKATQVFKQDEQL